MKNITLSTILAVSLISSVSMAKNRQPFQELQA